MIDTEGLTIIEYCHKRLFNWCRLKGYSEGNTFHVYKGYMNMILNKFPNPENVGLLKIQNFAYEFKNEHTRRMICILIRWLFDNIYKTPIDWRDLPYPKHKKKVQPVYLEQEIIKVLNAITNEKQKAILALIIDCGLRISEPCGILNAYCNAEERSIILRGAKGDNDRVIYPSPKVWEMIDDYFTKWGKNRSDKYLFDGQKKGEPYCETSIRETLKRYCKITGVKYLGVHAIRRFTITWSIENDVPISVIALKSGHCSTRTIERSYAIHSPTYLRNTASPLR